MYYNIKYIYITEIEIESLKRRIKKPYPGALETQA